jgi:hypothetical protein
MRRDYGLRGWPPERIGRLIAERLEEEFPVIQASLASADTLIDNGRET